MIKNFETYNESIRDKMISKELSPNAQMVYDAMEEVKELGYRIQDFKSNNQGQYEFLFIDNTERNNDRYINVYYNDEEEIQKSLKPAHIYAGGYGWAVSIYEGQTKSYSIENVNIESWEKVLLEIIYGLYPMMDIKIEETKEIIKRKENLLANLEKRKNILNDL